MQPIETRRSHRRNHLNVSILINQGALRFPNKWCRRNGRIDQVDLENVELLYGRQIGFKVSVVDVEVAAPIISFAIRFRLALPHYQGLNYLVDTSFLQAIEHSPVARGEVGGVAGVAVGVVRHHRPVDRAVDEAGGNTVFFQDKALKLEAHRAHILRQQRLIGYRPGCVGRVIGIGTISAAGFSEGAAKFVGAGVAEKVGCIRLAGEHIHVTRHNVLPVNNPYRVSPFHEVNDKSIFCFFGPDRDGFNSKTTPSGRVIKGGAFMTNLLLISEYLNGNRLPIGFLNLPRNRNPGFILLITRVKLIILGEFAKGNGPNSLRHSREARQTKQAEDSRLTRQYM